MKLQVQSPVYRESETLRAALFHELAPLKSPIRNSSLTVSPELDGS